MGQTTTSRDASTYVVTPIDRTTIQKNGFSVTATTGVRISGFTFDTSISGSATATLGVPINPVGMRIDHNHFFHPGAVWFKSSGGGYLNILFDNNRITQPAEETLYIVGAGNKSWTDGGSCGASDAAKMTIIEDNEFTLDSASVQGPIDSGEGARFIIRHNRFSAPTGFSWQEVIEAHGHCYGQRDGFDNAGGYCQIISDNRVYKGTTASNGNILAKVRAGKSYVYNNQIFGQGWAEGSMVYYWVQEVGTTCNATPCNIAEHATMGLHANPLPQNWMCTSYPCPMQPNNSYIWGNKMESGTFGASIDEAPASYMMENRDYWDDFAGNFSTGLASAKPATCAVNKNYWATDTTTLYRCTSANTWTSIYQEYTYPHPLQSQAGVSLLAPSGLTTLVR